MSIPTRGRSRCASESNQIDDLGAARLPEHPSLRVLVEIPGWGSLLSSAWSVHDRHLGRTQTACVVFWGSAVVHADCLILMGLTGSEKSSEHASFRMGD